MINPNKKFLICFCFPFFLSAQTINNTEVNGNTLLSDSEILNISGAFKGNQFYSGLLDSAKSRIAGELALKGYLNSTFEGCSVTISEDSQKVDLVININEGTPTFVNKVFQTSSDSSALAEINSIFSYLEGEVFDKFEIESNINELLARLENNGFPFASFTISSVHLYDDTTNNEHFADLYLLLEKGDQSSIDRIEIEGSTSTKDYVIIRELRIESGEGYSQEKVDDLPKRLNKLRFFEPVPAPTFYIDSKNNGVLLINVKEKNTNNFDGIVGYIPPSTDDEKGYVTGLVNVTLRNIFGTGRAAAVRWQKLDRNSQELELKYLEPWLFSYPFNLNAELFQRIQDSTYVKRKIGGSLEYLATEDISVAGLVASEEVIPTEREEPVFTVYNSSALTTGL
ncbi:MAG: POTRA domain-containing protein, partial [Ignavibacteriaceae bacterium]